MPGFESPLGSKKIAGSQLKNFDVADESEYETIQHNFGSTQPIHQFDESSLRSFGERAAPSDTEVERQIREAKQNKLSGKEKISESGKKRIEMLLGMTRMFREVNIDGNVYVFQTLKSKEFREVIASVTPYDGTTEFPFEMRRQLLTYSLIKVAGVDIADFLGSNSIESKLAFFDELDEPLLNRLYVECLALKDEAEVKYAVKKEQQVNEVISDLKK